MTDKISFGSTFRIPITQAGVNSAKKQALRKLVETYPNGIIGKSKVGYARVSIMNSDDARFVQNLKRIGYKVYQKFDGENISKENLDSFIKSKLGEMEYSQTGKNKPRVSENVKRKLSAKNKKEELRKERIRQTDEYKRIVGEYGEEAAEFIYFGR